MSDEALQQRVTTRMRNALDLAYDASLPDDVIWNRRRIRIHFGGHSRFDHELQRKPHLFMRDGRWRGKVHSYRDLTESQKQALYAWIEAQNMKLIAGPRAVTYA